MGGSQPDFSDFSDSDFGLINPHIGKIGKISPSLSAHLVNENLRFCMCDAFVGVVIEFHHLLKVFEIIFINLEIILKNLKNFQIFPIF